MIYKRQSPSGKGGLRRAADYLRAFDRLHSTPTRPTPETIKRTIHPAPFYRAELPEMPDPKRAHGWADGGLCPFHADTHAGSFRIHLETGAFRCFACGAHGGDLIAFTQQRHGLTFPAALARLAREWGAI